MVHHTTSDTVIVADIRQREQLRAMRQLHPDACLPQPTGQLARQILDDLLNLPDERDPLLWLREERRLSIAVLMLSGVLDLAAMLREGIHRKSRSHAELSGFPAHIVTEQTSQWALLFGQLLTSTDQWNIPTTHVETVASLSEANQLVSELAQLRRPSRLPTEEAPAHSLLEPGQQLLLADLLRLPNTVDPLQWLQDERSEMSARYVLTYLLNQVQPSPSILQTGLGSYTRSSVYPKARLQVRNISARVEQISFYESCFTIQLRARIHGPTISASSHPSHWQGFEQVIDDRGYHYLVQVADYQLSSQFWWWREHLTLLCWPALQEDARELTLLSQRAALTVYREPRLGGELTPMPSPVLGAMRVRVPLLT
jgi:hypothetical protein